MTTLTLTTEPPPRWIAVPPGWAGPGLAFNVRRARVLTCGDAGTRGRAW
jgi:hypothetical protein